MTIRMIRTIMPMMTIIYRKNAITSLLYNANVEYQPSDFATMIFFSISRPASQIAKRSTVVRLKKAQCHTD